MSNLIKNHNTEAPVVEEGTQNNSLYCFICIKIQILCWASNCEDVNLIIIRIIFYAMILILDPDTLNPDPASWRTRTGFRKTARPSKRISSFSNRSFIIFFIQIFCGTPWLPRSGSNPDPGPIPFQIQMRIHRPKESGFHLHSVNGKLSVTVLTLGLKTFLKFKASEE